MVSNNITFGALQTQGVKLLKQFGIESAVRDADLLLQFASKKNRSELISAQREQAGLPIGANFIKFIKRRCRGEPVFRIIGSREFYGRSFKISQSTLEPRSDTEALVDRILFDFKSKDEPIHFIDIGTGSGAIALTLLSEMSASTCDATDIDLLALETARQNAEILGVGNRVSFFQSDYLNGVTEQYDFIVSNPPYIKSSEIGDLQPEVRCFDPLRALDGGVDGLTAYRALIRDSSKNLKQCGRLYLEIGYDQANELRQISDDYDLNWVGTSRDLSGNLRVVVLSKQ